MRARSVISMKQFATLMWERQLLSAAPTALYGTLSSQHIHCTTPPSSPTQFFNASLASMVPKHATSPHTTSIFNRNTIYHSFSTNSAPVGADVAQKILAAEDLSDLSDTIPLLEQLDPAGLPAVARAAAVSGVSDKEFRDTLVNAAVRGLPSLSPADLCSVVESLAQLGAYSVAFKDATADIVLARLPEFSGDMLGHALRSFGKMSYYDDELLEAVVAHVASQPDKFSAENIADVVYAFSKCGYCHPDLVSVVERTGGMLLEEAALDRGEAIASIVDAYSRIGCSDPEVVDALIMRVAEKPELLSGDALSKLIVGTIRLGCEDQDVLINLLDAIIVKLVEMSPKNAVKIINALGELRLCHRPFLDAITEDMIPVRLNEFSQAGLSDLVNALNKLGYYNTALMALLEKQGVAIEKDEANAAKTVV